MTVSDLKALNWPSARSTAVSLIWLLALLGFILAVGDGIAGILPLFLFSVSSAGAITVVIYRPFSPFMMSLVLFFALGFWVKFVFHTFFSDMPWVEPTGRFSGSREQWAMVLNVASAAMLATILPALTIRKPRSQPCSVAGAGRFARAEPWLWNIVLIAGLSLFVLNYHFEFLRVGIDTRTILPFPFNAVLSFLLTYGIAIGIACIGYWSWSAGRLPMLLLIAIGIVEGALASWSLLSRLQIILHSGAFLMGWALGSGSPRARLGLKGGFALAGIFVVACVISTTAVSWERLVTYNTSGNLQEGQPNTAAVNPQQEQSSAPAGTLQREQPNTATGISDANTGAGTPDTPGPGPVSEQSEGGRSNVLNPEAVSGMVREVGGLFIDRWIGLEGLMSTVAYEGKGMPLFMLALAERPSVGNDGIYEHISASSYRKVPGRTFLTIPGCAAVLHYSGSTLIVFFGIVTLCFGAVLLERFALMATQSPFAMAVIALAAANSVAQLNHPYALFTLWVQLFAGCVAVYIFRRWLMGCSVSVERSQA